MTEYKKSFNLVKPEEENVGKKDDDKIKDIPIRIVSPFKISHELPSKYFPYEAPSQEKKLPTFTPIVKVYNDNEKYDLNFKSEVNSIWDTYHVPLPTNRKTRDPVMTPFRSSNFLSELAQIHQPEQLRTRWIFIFGVIFVILCILIVGLRFIGKKYYSTIFLSVFFLIITFVAYKAQKRRQKIRKIPLFIQYNRNEFGSLDDSDIIESPSAMFVKPPTSKESDSVINQSLSAGRNYTISDRPSADISKDQHGKTFDYDQSYVSSLKTLGITSVAFNIYLNNLKSFIPKVILSKLAKEMHKEDPRIVSMLTVPGYERYSAYIKNRIATLANSHSLAGHFGDKGDRYKEREWTTDFPSDNQIILHILDVWLSNFMNAKKKDSNNSVFSQKYVCIKKDPVAENEEDAIYLCTKDWSHFYVYTMFKEGKGLQHFYAPSGRDSMYAGLTLFFWFLKTKKKSFLEFADLTDDSINIDRIFSLDRLD